VKAIPKNRGYSNRIETFPIKLRLFQKNRGYSNRKEAIPIE